MSDHSYSCTTTGCEREGQLTGARWCVACGTPTQAEQATSQGAAPTDDHDGSTPPAGVLGPQAGASAPGRPLLSVQWRQAVRAAAVGIGVMLGFSLLVVALFTTLVSDGQAVADNAGGVVGLAVTLATLSMHGALVIDGSVATFSATVDQGHLSVVLPPLFVAVVGLTGLAVATARLARQAPPRTADALAVTALRTGAVFGAMVGAAALFTNGVVQGVDTVKMSWHVAPIGVAWWSLLLGTLAAGLGEVAAVVRTGDSSRILDGVSPTQRVWLRALGGGAVAAGSGLALATLAVALVVGVGLWRDASASQASSSLVHVSPWPVIGLTVLLLPAATIHALGLGMGATLVAGSSATNGHFGYLAGSDLPGWTYLLLLIPAGAVVAGGLWAAAREQADPDPQPGGWLRYAATTTALFGLLLVLARTSVRGSAAGGVSSAWSLLQTSGQDRFSVVTGFRLIDALLLAFGWAALGGLVAERLFPVILARYGRRLTRLRIGRLALLPIPPAKPQQPAAPRRPTRTVGVLTAVVVVLGAAVWLGTDKQPAGTLDWSVAAKGVTPANNGSDSQPSPTMPPETLADGGSSAAAGDVSADTGEPAESPAELTAGATASASATAPDNKDAAGNPVSYTADNLVDGDPQTAWRVPGDGHGVTVTLTLPSSAHLTQVGLIPGYAKVDPSSGVNRFPENRRIRTVRWHFDDGTTVDQRFSDSPSMQRTAVDASTGSVTIEILSSRPGDPDHDYVPISEVSLVGTS
jgi:hypothetical protein